MKRAPKLPGPKPLPPGALVGDGTEEWHGKVGGFTNHLCACGKCREAWREYQREWRARRKAEREGVAA